MNYVSYTASKPNGDFVCESNMSVYGAAMPGAKVPSFADATLRVRQAIERFTREGWELSVVEEPLSDYDLECLREFQAI